MVYWIKVSMHKYDKDGNMYEEAHPEFKSNPNISSILMNFDLVYNEHHDKIVNDFVAFNANGSGWILNRVNSASLHMMQYSTGEATADYDSDNDVSVYSTE